MKNFEISSRCGVMISTVKVNEEEILKDIQTPEEIKKQISELAVNKSLIYNMITGRKYYIVRIS